MDIWELVSLVALAYACYKAGQWSVIIPIARGIQRDIDAGILKASDLEDEDEEDERRVRIERHDNVYYAYALDGDFLAQGSTFNELFERFHARFPSESFRIQKSTDLSDNERGQMISAIEELAKRINVK
jgi:hypothetical protein